MTDQKKRSLGPGISLAVFGVLCFLGDPEKSLAPGAPIVLGQYQDDAGYFFVLLGAYLIYRQIKL
jgi:hypothetical protein